MIIIINNYYFYCNNNSNNNNSGHSSIRSLIKALLDTDTPLVRIQSQQ